MQASAYKAGCVFWVVVLIFGTRADAQKLPAPTRAPQEEPETGEPPHIGRTDAGLLQLHVRDVDLGLVLRLLGQEERVNIVTGQGVRGKVTADLYGVTFEEALAAILRAQGLVYERHGKFVYVMTLQEQSRIAASRRRMASRVFKLKFIPAAEAATLIQPVLSADGKIAQTSEPDVGVPSGTENTGGDSLATADTLVVVDYLENLKQVAAVLEEIDQRPRQVLIEATILRATLRETNELGIDFNTLGGVDFRGLSSVSGGVMDLDTGLLPAERFDGANATFRTDFNGQVSSGGFTFGLITNQVALFIRALEQITDVTVMANPKILALNKQRGEVIVGRRDGYLTTTVTETAAVQTVEFLETGTQLIFRPFIYDDEWVRMELHPEDSNGGLTAADLPFEETTEATTNIMLRDGQTIVIGGLFRERTTAGRDQVPFLGSIPGLGVLFQRTDDDSAREEVVILLTVHIIKDTPAEAAAMDAVLDDAERVRAGARHGLLPFGRERLAQAHYRWAWSHLSEGRVNRALADLRMALHHRPRMRSARQLQEKLLQRRMWDEEATRMRTFVYDLIQGKDEAQIERFGRPLPGQATLPHSDAPGGEDDGVTGGDD